MCVHVHNVYVCVFVYYVYVCVCVFWSMVCLFNEFHLPKSTERVLGHLRTQTGMHVTVCIHVTFDLCPLPPGGG